MLRVLKLTRVFTLDSSTPKTESTSINMGGNNANAPMDSNASPNTTLNSTAPPVSFRTDFGQLFKTLCSTLDTDESTLLLYLLLHQNLAFRSHVIASSDIEQIVLPILR